MKIQLLILFVILFAQINSFAAQTTSGGKTGSLTKPQISNQNFRIKKPKIGKHHQDINEAFNSFIDIAFGEINIKNAFEIFYRNKGISTEEKICLKIISRAAARL